jgi:hypothetical protein
LGGENERVRVSFYCLLFYNDARTKIEKDEIEKDKDILSIDFYSIDFYFKLDRQPIDRERISPTLLAVGTVPLKLRTTLSQYLKAYLLSVPFIGSKVSRPSSIKN